ncbi:MAG: VWA domain-containing protein, partial [Planctomycetota bacterium]
MEELSLLQDLTFREPGRVWLGLPLALLLLAAPLLSRRSLRSALLPLFLRGTALASLLLLLMDPVVPSTRHVEGRLVVIVDVSASISERGLQRQRDLIAEASGTFDLIACDAGARLSAGVTAATARIAAVPETSMETDLAAALRRAALRRQPGHALRITILSDGRPTRPGTGAAARVLREQGVEIYAFAISQDGPAARPSLRVLGLRAPSLDSRKRPFEITAAVEATAPTHARAFLYFNGALHRTLEIDLPAGRSDVTFPDLQLQPGSYRAQVWIDGDASPLDNLAGTDLVVPGTPKVLVLKGSGDPSFIAKALRLQDIEVDVHAAPGPEQLNGYDVVVVLPDAPVELLEERTEELHEFVGRHGGGLLAVGGLAGPGLARFAQSPLAVLVPLKVPPRAAPQAPPVQAPEPGPKPRIEIVEEEKEAFPITLCLLVDTSGSMGRDNKLQRAVLAAAAAARVLTREDRIAVIGFSDGARILLPTQRAGDPNTVFRALRNVRADGHTDMFAALKLSSRLMDEETTPIRHVVLLTDGDSTDNGPWRDLTSAMVKKKITISTVEIGFVDTRRLLPRLANWGHGRWWRASNPREIPEIITQDTMRVVKVRDRWGDDAERPAPEDPEPEPPPPERDPEPEEPPPPEAVERARLIADPAAPREALRGIPDAGAPEVANFEQGTLRFASWTAARGGEDGPPVLVYRRIGLGTAAALAFDPEGPHNGALREHPAFPQLMAQIVRSLIPDVSKDPWSVRAEVRPERAAGRLYLQLYGEDGRPR